MPSGFSPSVNASVKTTLSKSEPFTSAFLFLPALPIQYFFFAHFLIVAEVMQQLGLRQLVREPNVYTTVEGDAYIQCYVDDRLFIGQQETVTKLFKSIQQHILLRPTGDLTVGNTIIPSASWAETFATQVITTRSALHTATQQNFWKKQA